MDLRRPRAGILIGGTPAPGVNAVISSVVIEFMNNDCIVMGIIEGLQNEKKSEFDL